MRVGIEQLYPSQSSATKSILKNWSTIMARTLEDFIALLPEDEQRAIQEEAEQLIAEEMTLRELRKARARSQQKVGRALHINQAAVSKLERRTDMYVSTL